MSIDLDIGSDGVWTLTTGEAFSLAETLALIEKTEWRRGVTASGICAR